jgi:hypothetical protein
LASEGPVETLRTKTRLQSKSSQVGVSVIEFEWELVALLLALAILDVLLVFAMVKWYQLSAGNLIRQSDGAFRSIASRIGTDGAFAVGVFAVMTYFSVVEYGYTMGGFSGRRYADAARIFVFIANSQNALFAGILVLFWRMSARLNLRRVTFGLLLLCWLFAYVAIYETYKGYFWPIFHCGWPPERGCK